MSSKSVPLISPTIFKLVILYFLLLPILLGKVPALSSLMVICWVIKSSSAAWAETPHSNKRAIASKCFLKINLFIIIIILLNG